MCIQRKKAKELKIQFKACFLNIAEDQPTEALHSPLIMADEQRFMQILLNLQSNALKFTDGGGMISITSELLRKN